MLLLLILIWIKPFYIQNVSRIEAVSSMPLWRPFSFINNSLWLSPLFSLLAAIIITLNITRFISKYTLLGKPTALPGFIFILIISGFSQVQYFSPTWISAIFFTISLEFLFLGYNRRKTMQENFLAFFWLSVSSLFFYKMILLIPLFFIIMVILNTFSFRSFLACIVGIIVPWLFILGYELLYGSPEQFVTFLQMKTDKITSTYTHNIHSAIFLSIISLFYLIGLFSVINHYGTKKIFTRKQYQVFIISSLYLILLMIFTGTGTALMPIMCIPVTFIISHLIDQLKSRLWQNVIFITLIISSILGLLFL